MPTPVYYRISATLAPHAIPEWGVYAWRVARDTIQGRTSIDVDTLRAALIANTLNPSYRYFGLPMITAVPRLHVHRTGAGEPLVLLHGLGESHIGWRPVIDALSKQHDVIAVDLPGFGRSPALPGTVLPNAVKLAAAVERTLDQLGIGAYHVAGYSLGVRVAIQLADSDRVRSVIAIAPDGLGTPVERLQGFIAMVAGRGVAMALAPIDGWFPVGRALFLAGTRSLPWQIDPADAKQLLSDFAGSPAYEATNWASLFDMPTHLHTITQPALFLQGTADPLMAPQIARYVGLIPQAKLIYLPGLNHVPISDDPRTVAHHMLTFLNQAGKR
jgi:pimeloyl-ACP methyl ester carboxylesterase